MGIGGLAFCLFISAFLLGFYFGPLFLAESQSKSGLAVSMRWYLHLIASHFSEAHFELAFAFIQICIFGILSYFLGILLWLTKAKRTADEVASI